MTRPPASLSQDQLRETLIAVLQHADGLPACTAIKYRLVGTGAALLHGVDLPAADIDLLAKTRTGVDAFAVALSSYPCLDTPSWLPETRQYYVNYDVNGVEVGISTVEIESDLDTIETFGNGPWEHFVLLPCGPYKVPTVVLDLRLITELYRDRPDRYRPLLSFMQCRGYDMDFILRGMRFAGVPQSLQYEVLQQLKGSPTGDPRV